MFSKLQSKIFCRPFPLARVEMTIVLKTRFVRTFSNWNRKMFFVLFFEHRHSAQLWAGDDTDNADFRPLIDIERRLSKTRYLSKLHIFELHWSTKNQTIIQIGIKVSVIQHPAAKIHQSCCSLPGN